MTQQLQVKYRQDYCAPDYTVTDIDLQVELDAETTLITAVSKIERKNLADVPLQLNGENLTLLSISVNGEPWSHYRQQENTLLIEQLPAIFTLTIKNEIHPAKNSTLEGLYRSGDTLCTQCEAEGFRHITFYLDRPDVLARYTTRIIADKARYPVLLSNGNRIAQGELADGRHWVQWQDPFPKPCYLFALVAGKFDVLRDNFITRSGRNVALELFVDPGNLNRADWAMTSLKNAMKWDETRFGLEYDLDIYMIVAVDFFNMGAMENKGLNIFNAKYVLATTATATDNDYLNIEAVIGHEYFHNWSGNRVTCRDWFQLSLKEGLTVFRDQEFSSDMGSRAVNRIDNVRIMRTAQFAEDASPMAHAIRPDSVIEMNNFYTTTVYEKGAEVIRMMHTLLGKERFMSGMQLYFERHDGSAVTCDDFIQAMEDASSVSLAQFRRWYIQSGTPLLTIRDHYDTDRQQYHLCVSQQTLPTADQTEKLPLHIPLDIELYDESGDVIVLQNEGLPVHHVLSVTTAEQTFTFDKVLRPPIPALLREFSAPVRLDYNYSDPQLTFLMQHARNDFSRWDAAQTLLAGYIKLNVASYQHQQQPLPLPVLPLPVIDAFRAVLLDKKQDPALAARILTLPSEPEMAELFTLIDPDAIHAVHRAITRSLAQEMPGEFLAVYRHYKTPVYRIEHSDIARRSLRNCCLYYLAFGEPELADNLVSEHYWLADNMTDSMAALSAAVAAELPCRDTLLATFDEQWHHDGLVMDKWFMMQATSPVAEVLSQVRLLLTHRSFSLNNPNRTRSLIGAFASMNPVAFHAIDGSGYQFLLDVLRDLNTRNPQVAARLIEPLIRLKRYDARRQGLMKLALEELQTLDNLSGDLFEKITKALAD